MSAETAIPTAMAGEQRGSLLRSAGAVLCGFGAVFVISLGTDLVLHAAGVFPAWGQAMNERLFLLATAYRTLYSIGGSYIAARLAPNQPMQHAMALGGLGLVASTIGAWATWSHVPSLGPHWYPLALVVTAIPCAWLGGKLQAIEE
jgi:hypothetical protein